MDFTTVQIKKEDVKTLESLKDHPRQPLHEVISEVVNIATESKKKQVI